MTQELEQKLNELLGMKKQLEELTTEKKKATTKVVLGQYKTKYRLNLILFIIKALFGWALIVFGLILLQLIDAKTAERGLPPYVLNISPETIIIAGLIIMIVAKQGWRITQSKLTVLQELKQTELRILDAIEKRNGHTS